MHKKTNLFLQALGIGFPVATGLNIVIELIEEHFKLGNFVAGMTNVGQGLWNGARASILGFVTGQVFRVGCVSIKFFWNRFLPSIALTLLAQHPCVP